MRDSNIRFSMSDLMDLKDKLPVDPEQKETYAKVWNEAGRKLAELNEMEMRNIKDPTQPDSLVRHYLDDTAKLIIQYRPNLIRTLLEEYKNKRATG